MGLARLVRYYRAVSAACVSVVVLTLTADAGTLDSAKYYWQVVNHQLGGDSIIATVDTLSTATVRGGIFAAVDACIRDVAAAIGLTGKDTLVVAQGTYVYTLNDNFIEDSIAAKGFKVIGYRNNRKLIYSLRYGPPDNFVEQASAIPFFDVEGGDIRLSSSVGDGDTLIVTGPVTGTTFSHGNSTTNIYEQDRSAVCDCATARVAASLGMDGKAAFYRGLYMAHIAARRGGAVPQAVQ